MTFATDLKCGVLLALLLVLPASAAMAQDRTPLLMEGKSTLYERVLTAPRARFSDSPGGAPAGVELPAFSSFYVYDRREVGGTPWVELGNDRAGRIAGWMPESSTIPWRQQMALTFANPAGRERNLLFADGPALIDILESDDPAAAVAPLRQAALAGEASDKVVALEPSTHVDFSQNFYLLPILSSEQAYTASGAPVRALEIASVTKIPEDEAAPPSPATDRTLREFSAAVVFVIDTTISMGPYIDRTREAVRRISERLADSEIADRIRFGLVAFRSNVAAVPELDYTARVFADPNEVASGEAFLEAVRDLEPATASSSRFDEDAFAGVLTALDEIDLSKFGARYLVLITDAGALRGNDTLSSTGLDAEQLAIELRERGAALYALHLKTPAGVRNHASAEAQYRALAAHPLARNPLYYPIDAGSVEAFGSTVESLAGAISDMASAAFRGDEVPGGAVAEPASVGEQIRRDAFEVGRAMQLAWLGRVEQARIPDFFRAFIADRDFADPLRQTTEVRVFLSRNQVSDLFDTLSGLVDELDRAQGEDRMSSSEFFDSLRSVAAKAGRDPAELADGETARLGDLGLFDEYLGDLPYKSTLMTLDLEEWRARPTAEQEQLLDAVRRKLRLYRLFMEDADRWVTLSPDAPAAEAVYPVPIDALP